MIDKVIVEKLKANDKLIDSYVKENFGYSPSGNSHFDSLIEENDKLMDQLKEVNEATWKLYLNSRY